MNLKSILENIAELFFPSMCEGCGKVGSYLCGDCTREYLLERQQRCHICKSEITNPKSETNKKFQIQNPKLVHEKCKSKSSLDGVFVVFEYNKFLEDYIGDIKYEYYFAMVDDLVKVMSKVLDRQQKFIKIIKDSVFAPVPLSPWRRRDRGFNQSELLSVKLSKRFNVKSVKLLKRIKNTKKQVGLKRKERLKNVKDVFRVREDVRNIKKVILVDDVMTTGATLEECAKELKKSGVGEVYGLVVGRG